MIETITNEDWHTMYQGKYSIFFAIPNGRPNGRHKTSHTLAPYVHGNNPLDGETLPKNWVLV